MRKKTQGLVLAGSLSLIASLGGLTGCASSDRSSGQVMDDMLTARRVSSALNDSPIYKFNDVDVKSYNGVVQLSGWAMSQQQKSKASDITKNVRGVREVINNISLKTEAEAMQRPAPVSTGSPGSQQGQIQQQSQQTSPPPSEQQQQQENQRQEELRRQQLTP